MLQCLWWDRAPLALSLQKIMRMRNFITYFQTKSVFCLEPFWEKERKNVIDVKGRQLFEWPMNFHSKNNKKFKFKTMNKMLFQWGAIWCSSINIYILTLRICTFQYTLWNFPLSLYRTKVTSIFLSFIPKIQIFQSLYLFDKFSLDFDICLSIKHKFKNLEFY